MRAGVIYKSLNMDKQAGTLYITAYKRLGIAIAAVLRGSLLWIYYSIFWERLTIYFFIAAVVVAALLSGSDKGGLYQGIKGDIMGAVYRCLMGGDNVPGCIDILYFVSVCCCLFCLVLVVDLIYECLLFCFVVNVI